MSERSEKIAELYYRSGSVQFGSFPLSIHQDHPELPWSPWYLHYTKPGEPGSELLPELYGLIGDEFYDICEAHNPPIRPTRITGLPNGALSLGDSLAKHYNGYPRNLLKFMKVVRGDGSFEFGEPEGEFEIGDNLLPCEDHISGGRNNLLFLDHVRRRGFVVVQLMAVVNRQQGGVANLAAKGVDVLAIFTGDELLDYGLDESHITQSTYDKVQEYRAQNQFKLAGL